MEDFYDQLGAVVFASRLRRLSDRFASEASRIYDRLGVEFRPAWFPCFRLLASQGPMPSGSIGQTLGVSHASVKQLLTELEKQQLVGYRADPQDGRVKIVELTRSGQELAENLSDIWEAFAEACQSVLDESGYPVLEAVGRVERILSRKGMEERFFEAWDRVEIVTWDPKYKQAFYDLNVAWIGKYFVVEPADEEILRQPEKLILEGGGQLFFAIESRTGRVLGTSALQPLHGGWELAKMAVDPSVQGRGLGRRLALTAIDYARQIGAQEVVLETNSRLRPAITLYESLGFKPCPPPSETRFERADVFMALPL